MGTCEKGPLTLLLPMSPRQRLLLSPSRDENTLLLTSFNRGSTPLLVRAVELREKRLFYWLRGAINDQRFWA